VLMISTFLSPIARSPISRSPDRPIARSPISHFPFPKKSPISQKIAHFPKYRRMIAQSDVTIDNTGTEDTAPYRFPTPKNHRPLLSNIAQIPHSLQTQEMHPAQLIARYNCHSIRQNCTAIKLSISAETSNFFAVKQIPDFQGFIV
jgi:hypothetical protein